VTFSSVKINTQYFLFQDSNPRKKVIDFVLSFAAATADVGNGQNLKQNCLFALQSRNLIM
jgi:hypothetical protein